MTLIYAHAGHVLVDLGIYLGPLIVIGVALRWSDRRTARRGEDEARPRR